MKFIMVSSFLISVALAELSCECGWRNTGRIIIRKNSLKNEYPWMVAVQQKKVNVTFCGGSIITTRHVISAAHCFEGYNSDEISLILGGNDLNNLTKESIQRHSVERIQIHPSFKNKTLENDIAILVTSNEIKFNKFVGPVCMPSKLLDEMTGQIAKTMGWGLSSTKHAPQLINKLKEVDLKMISHVQCEEAAYPILCTNTVRNSTCLGDSGGPLVWIDPEINRFTLVGVVSFGYIHCDKATQPGFNVNVSAYLKWIEGKIKPLKSEETKTCHKIEN